MGGGVGARRGLPRSDLGGLGTGKDGVGFGMDADQRAVGAGGIHHPQDGGIFELDRVGREQLDGAVTGGDQPGEVGLQIAGIGIGDDHVEGVVDQCPACRTRGIVCHRRGQRLAGRLGAERDDRGGSAHGGRARRRLEGVRAHQAHARHLLDMGMGVDAAGHHPTAAGLDALPGGHPGRRRADGGDPSVAGGEGAVHDAGRGHDAAVADCQICGRGHGGAGPGCGWAARLCAVKQRRPGGKSPKRARRGAQGRRARGGAMAAALRPDRPTTA